MQIIPIKELKDGTRISELCHTTNEPVHVTKNGYADMVIMSTEVYEELARRAQISDATALVLEGVRAAELGKTKDAFDTLAAVRAKYGI